MYITAITVPSERFKRVLDLGQRGLKQIGTILIQYSRPLIKVLALVYGSPSKTFVWINYKPIRADVLRLSALTKAFLIFMGRHYLIAVYLPSFLLRFFCWTFIPVVRVR